MYGNPDWKAVPVFLDVMMAVTVCALALAILINSTTSHLISLYGYLASTVLVGLSYLVNTQIIDQVIKAGFFNTFHRPLKSTIISLGNPGNLGDFYKKALVRTKTLKKFVFILKADVVSATANSTGAQNETIGWLSGPGPLILANYACQSMIGFTR